MAVIFLVIGVIGGAVVAWVVGRAPLGAQLARLQLGLELERASAAEKVAVLIEAREELSTQLRSMCAEALRGNNEQFMVLAKTQFHQLQQEAKHDLDSRHKAVENLVGPLKESLE